MQPIPLRDRILSEHEKAAMKYYSSSREGFIINLKQLVFSIDCDLIDSCSSGTKLFI